MHGNLHIVYCVVDDILVLRSVAVCFIILCVCVCCVFVADRFGA